MKEDDLYQPFPSVIAIFGTPTTPRIIQTEFVEVET